MISIKRQPKAATKHRSGHRASRVKPHLSGQPGKEVTSSCGARADAMKHEGEGGNQEMRLPMKAGNEDCGASGPMGEGTAPPSLSLGGVKKAHEAEGEQQRKAPSASEKQAAKRSK